MSVALNQDIGDRLGEVAHLLEERDANRFRAQAYRRASETVRRLDRPLSHVFAEGGMAALEDLPGVGPTIASAIRELLVRGRLSMLDRLRVEHDPVALLRSVPGIGKKRARELHERFGIGSLADLEAALMDGRVAHLTGLGEKRLSGIRDSLAQRLARVRASTSLTARAPEPPVSELLEVDREYRRKASLDTLRKIAPHRFNREREAWLPILHATRDDRRYTALFSNTARAHQLHKTTDWVVLYYDGPGGERQCTVVTGAFGPLRGRRVVRGRELECERYYALQDSLSKPPADARALVAAT